MKLKYVSLTLLAPSMLIAMESANKPSLSRENSKKTLATSSGQELKAPAETVLAIEQVNPSPQENNLKVELLAALRSNKTIDYVSLLAEKNVNRSEASAPQARSADQIVSALAVVNSSLQTEQGKLITSQLQSLFPRYQYAIPPFLVTLGLLANIGLTAAQFKIIGDSPTYVVTDLDKGQFVINIVASAYGAFIAGFRTCKEVKKGYYDTRQDKAVENLKGAQLTLTLLKNAGTNADGSIKEEYLALIQKQEQLIAEASLVVAQATVAAQQASAEAQAAAALDGQTKGKEETTPRSLLTRDNNKVVLTSTDHDNNVPVPTVTVVTESDTSEAPATHTPEQTVERFPEPTPRADPLEVLVEESRSGWQEYMDAEHIKKENAQ